MAKGSIVFVGTGIGLAGQITLISKSYIEQADLVYGLLPNSETDRWVQELNPNFVNLQSFYRDGKSRVVSYREMVNAMLDGVRAGKKVVGAFYGHAGVFALVPHETIRLARAEGFSARMEPGVSALDCLVADLGIDPGTTGCLELETTQMLFYKRQLDPVNLLILWQIGFAGEHTMTQFGTNKKSLQIVADYLEQWYPDDHEVILYEAPFLPTQSPRIERLALSQLPDSVPTMASTLVVPPAKQLQLNQEMLDKFGITPDELGFITQQKENAL